MKFKERKSHLWIFTALAGFALSSLCFYPGFINGDSAWQLQQARLGHYNDWHPVVMSILWRYLDRCIAGTGGIYLFHNLLFWIGLSLFAQHTYKRPTFQFTIPLIVGFYFPILCTFSVITKDSGFMGAMCLAAGLLYHASEERSRVALGFSALALFYAFAIRYNGFLSVIPFYVWFATVAIDLLFPTAMTRFKPYWKKVLLGLFIFFVSVVAEMAFETFVVKPEHAHLGQALMVFDVVAISVRDNTNYLPAFYDRGPQPLTVNDLKQVFNPQDSMPLEWPPTGHRGPGFLYGDQEFTKLLAAWIATVMMHPRFYLESRAVLFKGLLEVGTQDNWPFWFPNDQELNASPAFNRPIKKWIIRQVTLRRNSFLFKAYFYMALIIGALLASLYLGVRSRVVFYTLASSALLYEAGYFFLALGGHFRYSCWPLCVALLLPMGLYFQRRGTAARSSRE